MIKSDEFILELDALLQKYNAWIWSYDGYHDKYNIVHVDVEQKTVIKDIDDVTELAIKIKEKQ